MKRAGAGKNSSSAKGEAGEKNSNVINAIEAKHVTFGYLEGGRPILKDVSLTVPSGKITVLMGHSGCGKSTLAAVLCGLFPENGGILESGEITLFGDRLTEISVSERTKYITMMFQNPDLQFCMTTLREELYFCMENLKVDPKEMKARAEEAARVMQTYDLLDQKLFSLSGGEKQRAMLTCTYLLDSKCLVLDEAFANLDPDGVRGLMELLKKMKAQGKTVVAIDHMCDHWIGTADRFVIIGEEGRVITEIEDPENLPLAKDIFLKEGIVYPGIWSESLNRKNDLNIEKTQEKSHENEQFSKDGDGIYFNNFTLTRVPQKPAKKGKKRKKNSDTKNQELLIENADFFIPAGKITAILGKSGLGKTSLLMTLLKQRDFSGDVTFVWGKDKFSLKKMSEKECFQKICIAFQNPSNQFVTQDVTEEVADGIRRRFTQKSDEEVNSMAFEMLDRCRLKEYRNYSPYMLSQGQQRRLAVLSILSGGQKLLLLDEPTYGQDYASAKALMELVSEHVREQGLTVIMTTHDRGLASAYADRQYMLNNKKFEEVETP